MFIVTNHIHRMKEINEALSIFKAIVASNEQSKLCGC